MVTSSPIYSVPEGFEEALRTLFQGRLRIRWSLQESAWIIEQRVGAAALPPIRVDPGRDDHIQARDGFAPVMTIEPGTRMACDFCGLTLDVPIREIREVPCEPCLYRGRDARFLCTYWPLDSTLLDHLRAIDPEVHGGREMKSRIMAALGANDQLVSKIDKGATDNREAAGRYYFPQMMGIQSVGWTPATR